MHFELFIASRYLRAKRRQAVIGVITAISIVGVAAGVTSLIVALAINNGFRQDLQDRLLGSTSHVNVLRTESDGIKDWQPLMDRLSKQPHVMGAAPAIYDQVLISRGPLGQSVATHGKPTPIASSNAFGNPSCAEASTNASAFISPVDV